ncbi:MAG: hypothetical protein VX798_01510 [Bacteroidota bacterium]|nr:hypothetical protein [Bacteroidota bacterium]
METKTISRQELYDLVWAKPLGQVAQIFQMKDHVLKKLCQEHTIPLPKLGYWQKIKYGKAVQREELPKTKKEIPIELLVDKKGEAAYFKDSYLRRVYELKHEDSLNFEVPAKLGSMHPLVKRTKIALDQWEGRKSFSQHRLYNGPEDILPIHAEAKLRPRALCFMNTLIVVIEKMGHQLISEYGRCHVQMFGQKTEINLRQKFNRVRTKGEHGYGEESWVKTEKLEFMAGPSHDQKRWIDKKTMVLEDCLPEIVAWIEKDCRYWHDLRAKQDEEKQLRELDSLRQKEQEKAIVDEKNKFDQLVKDMEDWEKANRIRAYITALEGQVKSGSDFTADKIEYIQWARKKAALLDPLCNDRDLDYPTLSKWD